MSATHFIKILYKANTIVDFIRHGLFCRPSALVNLTSEGTSIIEGKAQGDNTYKKMVSVLPREFVEENLIYSLVLKSGKSSLMLEVTVDSLLQNITYLNKVFDYQISKDIVLNINLENKIFDRSSLKDSINEFNSLVAIKDLERIIYEGSLFTYLITPENYSFADDIFLAFKKNNLDEVLFFIPDKQFLERNEGPADRFTAEDYFGMLIFLQSLASSRGQNLAKRQFYRRLIKTLDENNHQVLTLHKCILPTKMELFYLGADAVKGKINQLLSFKREKVNLGELPTDPVLSDPRSWNHILITGWYGTETNGDKAILGEVLYFLRSCSPDCQITITTICQRISIQTNVELDCVKYVDLVDLEKAKSTSLLKSVDAVVIGGGPLMESAAMDKLLEIFNEAFRQNKARILFGCGIGPIHTEKVRVITKKLVELSTAGFLRDVESYNYATQLYPDHKLKWACDPAFGYISRWRNTSTNTKDKSRQLKIAGLLRANTNEFSKDSDRLQLQNLNDIAANQIAGIIEPICCENDANLELLQMNAPWIGGDDRIFNRKVERSFTEPDKVNCVRKYITLEEQLHKLWFADVSVAMRYHGHIFSMALGIPFLSINYTGKGGKVESLINRINYNKWSVSWAEIDVDKASHQLKKLIEERKVVSSFLLEETNTLVELLYNTYSDVFGIRMNILNNKGI